MKKLALQAGFPNSFIISRGIEGSTNFSAYRTGKIYVVGKNINKKNSNKKSINEEIEFCSKDLGLTRLLDEKT